MRGWLHCWKIPRLTLVQNTSNSSITSFVSTCKRASSNLTMSWQAITSPTSSWKTYQRISSCSSNKQWVWPNEQVGVLSSVVVLLWSLYMSLLVCICLPCWLVSATIKVRMDLPLFTIHVLMYTCSLHLNRYIVLVSVCYNWVYILTTDPMHYRILAACDVTYFMIIYPIIWILTWLFLGEKNFFSSIKCTPHYI